MPTILIVILVCLLIISIAWLDEWRRRCNDALKQNLAATKEKLAAERRALSLIERCNGIRDSAAYIVERQSEEHAAEREALKAEVAHGRERIVTLKASLANKVDECDNYSRRLFEANDSRDNLLIHINALEQTIGQLEKRTASPSPASRKPRRKRGIVWSRRRAKAVV